MAYFANGEEGRRFVDEFCDNCVHWQNVRDAEGREIEETWGCPVLDLHMSYSYELCNAATGDDEGRKIAKWMLDTLIEDDRRPARLWRHRCEMFYAHPTAPVGEGE